MKRLTVWAYAGDADAVAAKLISRVDSSVER